MLCLTKKKRKNTKNKYSATYAKKNLNDDENYCKAGAYCREISWGVHIICSLR